MSIHTDGPDRQVAAGKVKVPAMLLVASAVLGLGFLVFGLVAQDSMADAVVKFVGGLGVQGDDLAELEKDLKSFTALDVAMNVLDGIVLLVVLWGGVSMLQLKSRGLALAAAILALVPLFGCCCLGVPAGVWALVVLSRPDVKAAFAGQR